MPESTVSNYLAQHLSPTLLGFGVSQAFVTQLCATVKIQMLSALLHWKDISYRKALLITVSEEAPFYEPAAKADVKGFVVLTLRNSPFETLQSKSFAKAGLARSLSDDQIKAVTKGAIIYFSKYNLEQLSKRIEISDVSLDYYGEVTACCPVTWAALSCIACTSAKQVDFPRLEIQTPFVLSDMSDEQEHPSEDALLPHKAVLDGYSLEIDWGLANMLQGIAEVRGCFVVDCFKMLSRNMQKLLHVIEFLLTRDCAFATSNYFLSNGHAEQRTRILRAAACSRWTQDMCKNAALTSGLGHCHATVLKGITKQLSGSDIK